MKSVVLCLLVLLLCGAVAEAQVPDPFVDYNRSQGHHGQVSSEPDSESDAPLEASVSSGGSRSGARLHTERGSWSLGARTMISYASRNNDYVGGEASNNTLFVRAAPTLHVFVRDDLEVGVGLGPMVTSLARAGGSSATESSWLLEVGAHYYLKLSPQLAFAPGLSIGPYIGSSEQELSVEEDDGERTVQESTDTLGVLGTLYLSIVYQLFPQVQLRSGLALAAMWGREHIPSASKSYSTQGTNLSIPVEIYYTF